VRCKIPIDKVYLARKKTQNLTKDSTRRPTVQTRFQNLQKSGSVAWRSGFTWKYLPTRLPQNQSPFSGDR